MLTAFVKCPNLCALINDLIHKLPVRQRDCYRLTQFWQPCAKQTKLAMTSDNYFVSDHLELKTTLHSVISQPRISFNHLFKFHQASKLKNKRYFHFRTIRINLVNNQGLKHKQHYFRKLCLKNIFIQSKICRLKTFFIERKKIHYLSILKK